MQTYEYFKKTYGYLPVIKKGKWFEATGVLHAVIPITMNAYLSALAATEDKDKQLIVKEALQFYFDHNDKLLNDKYRNGNPDEAIFITEEYDRIYGRYAHNNN